MKYLILIYYILSYTSGAVCLTVFTMLHAKRKEKLLGEYCIFLWILFGYMVVIKLFFYISLIAGYENGVIKAVFLTVLIILNGAIFYSLPSIVTKVLGNKPGGFENIIFKIITLLSLVLIAVSYILGWNNGLRLAHLLKDSYYGYMVFFFGMIGWLIWKLWNGLKRVERKDLKKVLKATFVLVALFYPVFIMEGCAEYFFVRKPIDSLEYTLLPLFYIIWNGLNVIFAWKYLLKKGDVSQEIPLPDKFIKEYRITEREKQIIELSIRGLSHGKIGKMIYMSPGTVRNYLYGVYRKTGVNNKLSLIQLIQKMEWDD